MWRAGAALQLCCAGFSLRWLLLLQSTGPRAHGFSRCSAWVALQHVESSWTRDRTHVLCTGRQILNHWTTREVLFNVCLWSPIPELGTPVRLLNIAEYILLSFLSIFLFKVRSHWVNISVCGYLGRNESKFSCRTTVYG